MTEITCTVTTAPGERCGAPSVETFTTRRGETLAECAEHHVEIAPAPVEIKRPASVVIGGKRIKLGSTARAFVLIDVTAERVVKRSDSTETLRVHRRRTTRGRGIFAIVETATGEIVAF